MRMRSVTVDPTMRTHRTHQVNILGPNYIETLRADLSEEALQWVTRRAAACRMPHAVCHRLRCVPNETELDCCSSFPYGYMLGAHTACRIYAYVQMPMRAGVMPSWYARRTLA